MERLKVSNVVEGKLNKTNAHSTPTTAEDIGTRARFLADSIKIGAELVLAIGNRDNSSVIEQEEALHALREDVVRFMKPGGWKLQDYGEAFDILVRSRVKREIRKMSRKKRKEQ